MWVASERKQISRRPRFQHFSSTFQIEIWLHFVKMRRERVALIKSDNAIYHDRRVCCHNMIIWHSRARLISRNSPRTVIWKHNFLPRRKTTLHRLEVSYNNLEDVSRPFHYRRIKCVTAKGEYWKGERVNSWTSSVFHRVKNHYCLVFQASSRDLFAELMNWYCEPPMSPMNLSHWWMMKLKAPTRKYLGRVLIVENQIGIDNIHYLVVEIGGECGVHSKFTVITKFTIELGRNSFRCWPCTSPTRC